MPLERREKCVSQVGNPVTWSRMTKDKRFRMGNLGKEQEKFLRHWKIGSIQRSWPFSRKEPYCSLLLCLWTHVGFLKPEMTAHRTQWQPCQMPQRTSASEVPNLYSSCARTWRNCLIDLSRVELKLDFFNPWKLNIWDFTWTWTLYISDLVFFRFWPSPPLHLSHCWAPG